jgi:hypothetical protein
MVAPVDGYTPRAWKQRACTRVNPLGTVTIDYRYPGTEVEVWIDFNRRNRPDNALLVNDELVELGTHFTCLEEVAEAMRKRPTDG